MNISPRLLLDTTCKERRRVSTVKALVKDNWSVHESRITLLGMNWRLLELSPLWVQQFHDQAGKVTWYT